MPARRLSLSPPTSLRSAPFKMTLKIVKTPQAHFTSRYGHALELSHRTRNPGLIKTLFVLGSSSILFKSLRLPLHQDTVGPRCFCSLIASILPYLASMLISVPFTLLALRHIDVFANVFRTTTLSCSVSFIHPIYIILKLSTAPVVFAYLTLSRWSLSRSAFSALL
jgi:hypothetical protein